jgi:hypothetical protein
VADRWFPSSKTCSCCGSVKAELDLSQRVFRCGPCGLVADRDCNACEKSCTTGRKLRGVSLWRGTLWRGSQEPRQTRLKEAGTERRQSALRSLAYLRAGFGERHKYTNGQMPSALDATRQVLQVANSCPRPLHPLGRGFSLCGASHLHSHGGRGLQTHQGSFAFALGGRCRWLILFLKPGP